MLTYVVRLPEHQVLLTICVKFFGIILLAALEAEELNRTDAISSFGAFYGVNLC